MTKYIAILIPLLLLNACARINPDVIQAGGNDYNIAIQQTNKAITNAMRTLQNQGLLQLAYSKQDNHEQAKIVFTDSSNEAVKQLKKKLYLDDHNNYQLIPGAGKSTNKQNIVVSTRSLLGVMHFRILLRYLNRIKKQARLRSHVSNQVQNLTGPI